MFKLLGLYWHAPLWLLLIPFVAIPLYFLWQKTIALSYWSKYLAKPFQAVLLSPQRKRRKAPLVLLGVMWVGMLLALAGPNLGSQEDTLSNDQPLVLILKVSPFMLATDLPPTRLTQAQNAVLEFVHARQPNSTAIVVYSGSAHTLVPLTQDIATLKNLLLAINPDIMPVQGNRADVALNKAMQLIPNPQQTPIVLIADTLDNAEQLAISTLLKKQDSNLHLAMLGTEEGVPLQDKNGQLLRTEQGNIALAQLDHAELAQFAKQINKPIYFLSQSPVSLTPIQAPIASHWREQALLQQGNQGYWLLLPILLLAAFMARRGWLFVIFVCLTPLPAPAAQWNDFWLSDNEKAQRLLSEDPQQAAQLFTDWRWKAVAFYQAGNYQQAAQLFAQGETAEDHYNLGNSLARLEQYEQALAAYEQALAINPKLHQASYNHAQVQQWLEQQETQSKANDIGLNSANAPSTKASTGLESADNALSTATNPELLQHNALEHWLEQIEDDPSELLRRKFWLEQQQRRQP
ncbi:VWA domain-containing protein [Pseudomonas sp. F1_0610]|uniref:VWA domain-containing protein n=1 Tax=Pseudomonas sp. F1_0610 TaxID=3114284 RepID=UPI0039C4907E